jgi:tetratricopeptide (TPR) repeat protein
MPMNAGRTYLERFADDPVAQRALLACAAALRLDDELATEVIEVVVHANGRTRELLHEVKRLGCVWKQWDGSWYFAEEVRKALMDELDQRVPEEESSRLRSHLADRAARRAAGLAQDGQLTTHRRRSALIEAGYQRSMMPDELSRGGEQLGAVWEEATVAAGEATARTVDYLAPEIEERTGGLPVQVLFLRGMAARARHDRAKQEEYFRAVWEKGRHGNIFALAAHYFGNLATDAAVAERAMRDSIEWNPSPIHQSHVLNSLGNLLVRDRRRLKEAEQAFRKSLDLDRLSAGRAQVWHSLGNLLARDRDRWPEAEGAYTKAMELMQEPADWAQVAASFANLLSKYHSQDADRRSEELAGRSLVLDAKNPWTTGVCYRVLGDVYERRGDYPAAIRALESLLETNRKLGIRKFDQRIQNRIARMRRTPSNQSEAGTE